MHKAVADARQLAGVVMSKRYEEQLFCPNGGRGASGARARYWGATSLRSFLSDAVATPRSVTASLAPRANGFKLCLCWW